MHYTLPLAQFLKMAKEHPDKSYLHQPVNRQLKTYTWAEVETNARIIAKALYKLGLSKGDRVGILSKNCAEWFVTDLAIMMAGMISVPIYHTANRETIQYIIEESGCRIIFVGKLDSLIEANAGIGTDIQRIIFPYPSIEGQHQWENLLNDEPLEQLNCPAADDTMTIVYTSGSTGRPKGVVISFENICSAANETPITIKAHSGDRVMSYLPLAHITERSVIEIASYYASYSVYFVESLDTFIDDVREAQPELFFSVPRLWNKFQSTILTKIPDKKLQFLLKIPFINKLVAKKIRTGLGLGSCRAFGSGSAPIAPSVLHWYKKIGMPICEAWGMSETSGMSCANMPFHNDAIGSIGKPIPCVEMKLGENQEILIRGPAVFKKYYRNNEASTEAFTKDWFHTGDKGAITANGDYKIIGRVKDKFKTAKGKYVEPVPIENLLAQNIDIEQICVIGSGRKQPVALVVMNQQSNQQNAAIIQTLNTTLEAVNSSLESHQKLDHIIVVKDEWTVKNNFLTPTLKIRRMEIEAAFQHYLKQEHPNPIFWEQ